MISFQHHVSHDPRTLIDSGGSGSALSLVAARNHRRDQSDAEAVCCGDAARTGTNFCYIFVWGGGANQEFGSGPITLTQGPSPIFEILLACNAEQPDQ